MLAERAGRVQSRDQLMEAVKGERLEAYDRSIDVHISRIRAAIEDDPKKPKRIKSVRGVGYRLLAPVAEATVSHGRLPRLSGVLAVGALLVLALVVWVFLSQPDHSGAGDDTRYRQIAVLQGLDKVTARVSTFEIPIGISVRFGTLQILARACDRTPPEYPPESAAYLEIFEMKPGERRNALFAGWMFASSPALSALEHPVYDVWVLDCIPAAQPTTAQ